MKILFGFSKWLKKKLANLVISEFKELREHCEKIVNNNEALVNQLGQMQASTNNVKAELMMVISAIVMQNSGELSVPNEFFEAINEDPSLQLIFDSQSNPDCVKLSLVSGGDEEAGEFLEDES